MFRKHEKYTITLKLVDDEILGSSVSDIEVDTSAAQAEHSELIQSETVITAGDTQTWQIQAYDIFENIVVGGTEARYGFNIMDLQTGDTVESEVDYMFEKYHATFNL